MEFKVCGGTKKIIKYFQVSEKDIKELWHFPTVQELHEPSPRTFLENYK